MKNDTLISIDGRIWRKKNQ